MKTLPWILLGIVVIIAIILYTMNRNSSLLAASLLNKNQTKPTSNTNENPYALGLSLAQLINNTQCGKNGNPPCTIQDLQNAGWSPEQIASAQAGTQTASQAYLCVEFGIGC